MITDDMLSRENLKMEPENNDQLAPLPPTKIKRKYTCKICNYLTINPREYLNHLKFVHDKRVKIVECPKCVYACQYRQKLNRHLRLVHKVFQEKSLRHSTGNSNNNKNRAINLSLTNKQLQQQNVTLNQLEQLQHESSQSYNDLMILQPDLNNNDEYTSFDNSVVVDGLHSILSQMIPCPVKVETHDQPLDLSFTSDMKTFMRHLKSQIFNSF